MTESNESALIWSKLYKRSFLRDLLISFFDLNMSITSPKIYFQSEMTESIESALIYSLLYKCIWTLIESSSWWGWWKMIWLRRECCLVHQLFINANRKLWHYNRPGRWGDDMITRSMIIIMKDDGGMMTWLHSGMI